MANSCFQNKDGDTSCKRVSGMLLICGGLFLDSCIAIGTLLGRGELITLKGMSVPMYSAGAALIAGGVFEHKYSKN